MKCKIIQEPHVVHYLCPHAVKTKKENHTGIPCGTLFLPSCSENKKKIFLQEKYILVHVGMLLLIFKRRGERHVILYNIGYIPIYLLQLV
jgi:hypothetical protein